MKRIKRLCSFLVIGIFIIVCFFVWKGYRGYRDALAVKSVEQMAQEIEEKDNYTTLDQMPKVYKEAVLAVEDKRFYSHHGIDRCV